MNKINHITFQNILKLTHCNKLKHIKLYEFKFDKTSPFNALFFKVVNAYSLCYAFINEFHKQYIAFIHDLNLYNLHDLEQKIPHDVMSVKPGSCF